MAEPRVVLVTGASSGIGTAIARRCLRDGLTVYASARRTDALDELASLGATAVALDVTDAGQIASVVERIEGERGGVDVLVNNAGFGSYGAMEDTPIDDARYQFEVNLFGPAMLTKAVLPGMRARGSGTIVNISSMGGRIYTPLGSWYHASKHALEGWSDCLRIELAAFGIDVIVIQPGLISTAFGATMSGPMMERSGGSAYAGMARRMLAATARSYREGAGTPPERVAATVARAIAARRPRTRYVVGKRARPALFLRKWFGDRAYDAVIRRRL